MSTEKHIASVDFGIIRYANCWEDADILLEALQPQKGDRILSVASAGDNSFAMLTGDPELVIGIDLNPVQLHLCELKKAAFTLGTHREFLEFLGFEKSSSRKEVYHSLASLLPENSRQYWNANMQAIEDGVIIQGKFEKYFAWFRRRLLPLIHSKTDIRDLFEKKSPEAQQEFYRKEWNTWRWRLFFRIFFSKYVMGKYGRDPEFLKQVNVTVSRYIFMKAENELTNVKAQQNYFLRHILSGFWGNHLPVYAREENFESIKSRINRISFVKGYAEEALEQYSGINVLNLSNIFEYMPQQIFAETATKLVQRSAPGARFAYWNLMVPRRISSIFEGEMIYEKEISEKLSASDKGFFYNQFIYDRKK